MWLLLSIRIFVFVIDNEAVTDIFIDKGMYGL